MDLLTVRALDALIRGVDALPVTDHPFFFTWSPQATYRPTVLHGGEGVYLDTDDGRFLDMGALVYQANAGYAHPKIVSAIQSQAERLCFAMPGAVYPEKTELAQKLLAHAPPGFTKVFFTLGGSDANENALKMARMVTGRYKLVSRYRSYHGATMGAVTATGDWRRVAVEPGIPGVVHVMDLDHGVEGTQIPRVLELEGNVGAVLLESIVGANGVLIPSPDYFAKVRAACDAHGAMMIVDEVLVGFGRTGKWFGIEHWKDENGEAIVPDMITCGKAITGGYATLGAVLVHERVAQRFEEQCLVTGMTHYAHPLNVTAALATLKVYEDEKLIERAATLEAPFRASLERMREKMPDLITANRVRGLISGTDLTFDADGMNRLDEELRKRRVMTHLKRRVNALVLSPPLSISEDELADGMARVEEALEAVR